MGAGRQNRPRGRAEGGHKATRRAPGEKSAGRDRWDQITGLSGGHHTDQAAAGRRGAGQGGGHQGDRAGEGVRQLARRWRKRRDDGGLQCSGGGGGDPGGIGSEGGELEKFTTMVLTRLIYADGLLMLIYQKV